MLLSFLKLSLFSVNKTLWNYLNTIINIWESFTLQLCLHPENMRLPLLSWFLPILELVYHPKQYLFSCCVDFTYILPNFVSLIFSIYIWEAPARFQILWKQTNSSMTHSRVGAEKAQTAVCGVVSPVSWLYTAGGNHGETDSSGRIGECFSKGITSNMSQEKGRKIFLVNEGIDGKILRCERPWPANMAVAWGERGGLPASPYYITQLS